RSTCTAIVSTATGTTRSDRQNNKMSQLFYYTSLGAGYCTNSRKSLILLVAQTDCDSGCRGVGSNPASDSKSVIELQQSENRSVDVLCLRSTMMVACRI